MRFFLKKGRFWQHSVVQQEDFISQQYSNIEVKKTQKTSLNLGKEAERNQTGK